MQLFGRQLSNWWLLLIPPLLILAQPLLLMMFFMGNGLAGAIIGPPAIWNRTWHSPPRSDVVGKYLESGRHLHDQGNELPAANLTLESDGSMAVANLPLEFGETSCSLSGEGSWTGPDYDQQIGLNVTSNGAAGSCESGSYSFLELAGHSKPYKLYWVVGDPDSGYGIWLQRN